MKGSPKKVEVDAADSEREATSKVYPEKLYFINNNEDICGELLHI
jgi:hypothetical protein